MGNLYAYQETKPQGLVKARATAITAAQTVEGNKVTWIVGTPAGQAGYTLTVAEYNKTRTSQYTDDYQPILVVKCVGDCSSYNVPVVSSDGAGGTTTHYTFAANYTSTPRYLVLRLSATNGADGSLLWEVA
jgi:hypothetical protein